MSPRFTDRDLLRTASPDGSTEWSSRDHDDGAFYGMVQFTHVPGTRITPASPSLLKRDRECLSNSAQRTWKEWAESAGTSSRRSRKAAMDFDGVQTNGRSRGTARSRMRTSISMVADMTRTSTCHVLEEPTFPSGLFPERAVIRLLAKAHWRFHPGKVCLHRPSRKGRRSEFASVKAPRTWPNSSLSKIPSGKPPVLTIIRGLSAR